jgi:DNA polymerase-2
VPRGFIVHPTYRVRDGVPVVQLFGRLESGDPFLVEETRYRPAFFVPASEASAFDAEPGALVEASDLRDMAGSGVTRITAPVPGDVPRLRDRHRERGGQVFEADVRFPYRFLTDRRIRATCNIRGRGNQRPDGLVVFRDPELEPAGAEVALRTLSIDLETTLDARLIFSAAFVCNGVEEVHLVCDRSVAGAIVHPEEPALLFAVMERIRALDPDVIVGWNVIDFDLRVWMERCEANRIPCNLGRTPDRPRLIEQQGRGRSRFEIPGRMVLDGIPIVRESIRLTDYRLETVAQEILGRGKQIDHEAPDAGEEIQRMWREDPESLVKYNLEDARLVPEILAHEGLLDLVEERSRLTGMQLDRVTGSVASFDLVYLPELRARGFVAPSVPPDRENVFVPVLDFKSLYPSLIRTFQLDPLAHARADEDADPIEAPNGARFARKGAVLPGIIVRLMSSRDEAKARGDAHASQAIKILMNSMFGVLGTPSCRFFDPDIANAITGFGQQTLHWTREAFEEIGVRVLYGDTDSVFVQLPEAPDPYALRAIAEELREQVQEAITSRVRATYRLEPRLELELEKIYDPFFLPRVRGGRSGSKKRYAGWKDGQLEIVGLESVRRDWPSVATRLQEGMLERLFTNRDPIPFAVDLVAELRDGTLDRELVYVKRIRKGSLDDYKSNAPHVQAARKAGEHAGRIIQYLITRTGPEPVLPGRPLPTGIDYEHYIEKVLRPVADSILREVGGNFGEVLGEPQQLSMF